MEQLGETAPLWRRFKVENDSAARAALIEHYTYLVRITVGRVAPGAPNFVERDDLYSAGAVGLIDAVDRFEPERGLKFETLAITKIRGAILEYLRREDRAPRSIRARIKAVEAAVMHLKEEHHRAPTAEEVADLLGVDVDHVLEVTNHAARTAPLSLTTPASKSACAAASVGGGEGRTLEDALPKDQPSPFDELVQTCRREALAKALDRLPVRERHALALYYYEGLTNREVGQVLKVCENRAYQIRIQGEARLRQYLAADTALFSDEA